jgi:hypothetical protein
MSLREHQGGEYPGGPLGSSAHRDHGRGSRKTCQGTPSRHSVRDMTGHINRDLASRRRRSAHAAEVRSSVTRGRVAATGLAEYGTFPPVRLQGQPVRSRLRSRHRPRQSALLRLGPKTPRGVNDSALVVSESVTGSRQSRAFLWQGRQTDWLSSRRSGKRVIVEACLDLTGASQGRGSGAARPRAPCQITFAPQALRIGPRPRSADHLPRRVARTPEAAPVKWVGLRPSRL